MLYMLLTKAPSSATEYCGEMGSANTSEVMTAWHVNVENEDKLSIIGVWPYCDGK